MILSKESEGVDLRILLLGLAAVFLAATAAASDLHGGVVAGLQAGVVLGVVVNEDGEGNGGRSQRQYSHETHGG
jgi:hypothetical protein